MLETDKIMERDKLKLIVRNLKLLVDALESEVFSDVEAYQYDEISQHISDYDEVFDDDDGYPD
jgi:hypothetical protein